MTETEAAELLARIQVLDNRSLDRLTLEAWLPIMADIRYDDAVRAVTEHFASSDEYLRPVHIVAAAARYEDERQREMRRHIEYGGVPSDVVDKPPFYAAMVRAAEDATTACIAQGYKHRDKVTVDSAFAAAREVADRWEAEHGPWRRRQHDYDAAVEPF